MLHPSLVRRGLTAGLALLALSLVPATSRAASPNPYGDCCVAQVTTQTFNTWTAVCGACATNPGTYTITQPDPARLVFTGPGGVSAASPYEAAQALCRCPSQQQRRNFEKQLRTPGFEKP